MIRTPDITEIYPKIFLIRLPLPLKVGAINIYLFKGEVPTLIDCGVQTPFHLETIETLMKKAGVGHIARILITHYHFDHSGIAAELAKKGAQIFTNAIDYEEWATYAGKDSFSILHEWMIEDWGVPKEKLQPMYKNHIFYRTLFTFPSKVNLIQAGDVVQAGDYHVQVLSTPGHTRGHVSYWLEKEKLIFSGDVLLPEQFAYPETWLEGKTRVSGLPSYINSLKKLESLGGQHYFPAHGLPGTNPSHRCRVLLKQIEKQVLRHVPKKDVYSGASRLCEKLGWDFLFFHLHHVFGWEAVQKQIKNSTIF